MSAIKERAGGELGVRYGMKLRRDYVRLKSQKKLPMRCPSCGRHVVMDRIAVGIWRCPKCGYKFTGSAFSPRPYSQVISA
ncbi:MAG: hypothetical protein ACP5GO_00930 [Thermoprotei archaeon]|jgi:large subunit ribosomal protein L37Ae